MISPEELKLVDNAFDSFHIPSKPEILTQIEKVLNADEPDMNALARLVASDIGVSSVVLKIINSPFYGMSRTISEIKQAVMLLGMEVIRALVVGIVLRRSYTQDSCISLERFWDSTTDIANTMVFIGNRIKDKVPLEKLYTMGLFQNCAIPAFAIKFNDYHESLAYAEEDNGESATAIEDSRYRSNHAVMGYFIANSWGLPKDICRVILNHHDLNYLNGESDEESRLLYATLKAAENMVNRVRRLSDTPEWKVIGQDVMDTLHLDQEDLDDLEDDVSEMF
jgi:HD-like signal output (HDOD) protein